MTYEYNFLDEALRDDQISTGDEDIDEHSSDRATSDFGNTQADVVCWPESVEDVAAVLSAANDRGVPVVPYAAGTGLEGSAVPMGGDISMDLTRMDQIISVRDDDFQIDVEPGVIGEDINKELAPYDLFLPCMPQSADISTAGGMIATDASGAKTVKYGEIQDWVLALEVVLADGRVINTGSKAEKTSSGYNLTDLFVGSEGTLGVITKATFKITKRPTQISRGRASFASINEAASAIVETMQAGGDIATIELLDPLSIEAANAYSGTDLPVVPTVFFEVHSDYSIEQKLAQYEEIMKSYNTCGFKIATDAEMQELWTARRNLGNALLTYDSKRRPAKTGDVAVPIGSYAAIIEYAKEIGERYDLDVLCFGHAGDGNVHYNVLVDPDNEAELSRGKEASDEIVRKAIELGGTATGEHGVGRGKRLYMIDEHGENAVETMRSIKNTLDPNKVLNPEKVLPKVNNNNKH